MKIKEKETNNTSTVLRLCFKEISASEFLKLDDESKQNILRQKSYEFLCRFFCSEIRSKYNGRTVKNDEILKFIISDRAWIAMIRRRKKESVERITADKDEIVNQLFNEIKEENYKKAKDFDTWHDSICSDNNRGMTYGQWQKLINITFKYLVVLNICFGYFKEIEQYIDKMHCPVDRKIANILLGVADEIGVPLSKEERKLFKGIAMSADGGWNNISAKNYETFQDVVGRICKKLNLSSKLYVDIIFW